MHLDQVAHDREPEPKAAGSPRQPGVRLRELLEDMREELGRDADAGVADHDLDVRMHAFEADLHTPPLRGELHGVREQIPHDLL